MKMKNETTATATIESEHAALLAVAEAAQRSNEAANKSEADGHVCDAEGNEGMITERTCPHCAAADANLNLHAALLRLAAVRGARS